MLVSKNIASIIKPPVGEVVVRPETIRKSIKSRELGMVAIGGADRIQRELTPDNNGVAYVDMNSSGRMTVDKDKNGIIATSALLGCTGVAGFARRADGMIATFVSHYDTVSQTYHFTHQNSPVNSQMFGFGFELATLIQYLVAYDATTNHDPMLGNRSGKFDEWTYLDQIQNTGSQLGENAEALLLPYQSGQGSTLASGRFDGVEGIFWNGIKVDFDAYLAPKETPASV
jgi:hypothetical protein